MNDPMEIFEAWLAKSPTLFRIYVALNFCKAEYADGTPKKEGVLFKLFSKLFYLQCSCCSALRGLLFGFILGFLACFLWR
jgi:hypothetical protein